MTTTTPPISAEEAAIAGALPPMPARRKNRKLVPTIIWAVALTLLTLLVLYPLVWLVFATFKPSSEFGTNPGLLPDNPTIDNFVKVWEGIGGTPLWRFFANSLIIAGLAVIGTVISSAMAAYAFARIRFRGAALFFTAMIGTLLLPFHVLIIPQYILFQKIGLVDTYVPLLIGRFLATEAFFVFLMVQFIRQLPREMEEAARIDGAGHIRIFGSIIVPLIRPAIITSSIFAFIWTWNDFLGPLLYITTPEKYPLPIALRLYNDATSTSDFGATVAVSMLALVPILIFFIVFQRFLVAGVATQGLKG